MSAGLQAVRGNHCYPSPIDALDSLVSEHMNLTVPYLLPLAETQCSNRFMLGSMDYYLIYLIVPSIDIGYVSHSHAHTHWTLPALYLPSIIPTYSTHARLFGYIIANLLCT